MLSTPFTSFRAHYQALVSSGAIDPDPAQAEAAEAFTDLERRLSSYKPVRKQGLWAGCLPTRTMGRHAASTCMARSGAARPC